MLRDYIQEFKDTSRDFAAGMDRIRRKHGRNLQSTVPHPSTLQSHQGKGWDRDAKRYRKSY